MAILTVGDLVAALLKQDQTAPVGVVVRWAGDSAYGDLGEIEVKPRDSGDREDNKVLVEGWLSNCDTVLEIGEPEASTPGLTEEDISGLPVK